MTKPAVEFEIFQGELHLVYRPRDDTSWVHAKFNNGETLLVKGTFHLTAEDLVPEPDFEDDDLSGRRPWRDEGSLTFVVALAKGAYFHFKPSVLGFDTPVLLHRTVEPTSQWFTAERKVSVLDTIQSLGLGRIVIGGPASDAIPVEEYERLIARFPTPYELKRYVLARVDNVIRQYADTVVDAEAKLMAYVDKRLQAIPPNLEKPYREHDILKYTMALERLRSMLGQEDGSSEKQWQLEIVEIILLLQPRYIKAFTEVRLKDADVGTWRRIDILLVDASGNVDVIEIKKPMGNPIMLPVRYRDHHLPLRDLIGAMHQVNHYLRHLNRWGADGEAYLTSKLGPQLPPDFKIRIVNPSGMVIMGRSNTLSDVQRRDLEVLRRDSKGVVDIITYDELLARLEAVLSQLRSGPAVSKAPDT